MFKILSNNSKQINAVDEEKSSRSKYPELLHENETIIMAFKSIGEMGRDKQYFTNRRILLKDGKGVGSARRNYLSIPYEQITSYSICSAGSFLDCDVELKFTAEGDLDIGIDFAADKVNIFEIQQFFNEKVLKNKGKKFQDTPTTPVGKPSGSMEAMMNWFGDNAVQLDATTVQEKFTKEYPALLPNEVVHIAFKSGRDTTILTDQRFMVIDVKGWTGKRIKFFTLPWSSVSAYSVETAGMWDRDTEIRVYTKIPSHRYIEQDLRNGKSDLFAIQRAFSDMILGTNDPIIPNVDYKQGHIADKVGLFTWDGDNNRPLDAVATNERFHTNPNILQPSEVVEMAFRGRRDMLLFTTRRLMVIDPQGITGRSIEFFSIPWKSIVSFAVQSAGKIMDLDAELVIWTDIMHDPPPDDDKPPEPGKSQLSFDFHKNKINILDIQKYISYRILGQKPGVQIPPGQLGPAPDEGGLNSILSRLGNDMKAIDAVELNQEFHTTAPLLLDGEDITMAFRAGRDYTIFTNKRIVSLDTIGLMGSKKRYVSIPYRHIRGFAVESAGSFDRDSELKVYTRNYWDLGKVNFDFRKGKADILAIQKFVASMVLENHDDAKEFTEHAPGAALGKYENISAFGPMLDFFCDDGRPDDPTLYEEKLRTGTPILLTDEHVIRVFRARRDKVIYTTKRFILVDVQGWTGKKVQYLSIPNEWFHAFSIETCGAVMDNEAEVYLHTESALGTIKQDILVKYFDIMKMHQYLTQLLFFSTPKEEDNEF